MEDRSPIYGQIQAFCWEAVQSTANSFQLVRGQEHKTLYKRNTVSTNAKIFNVITVHFLH